ncbi:hypothetical protein [Nonomuraea sp. LPB2021202275-12-8]|uniref:hypothetical protein n=1 Tax=Nonomuraea sp. LPB2021202275-12-8 TaxID=3120159 RepID=UPI00300D3E8A
MRGQGPGSEHERRETDDSAAPSTPPPSFGQRPSGERRVPQSYPEPPSVEEAEGWLSVEGESRSADARPRHEDDSPPAEAWLSVEDEPRTPEGETRPAVAWPPAQGGSHAAAWPPAGAEGRPPAWPPAESEVPAAAAWSPTGGGDLPALPAFPGAQPWEVREGDAAPYDWFAGPEGADEPPVTGTDLDATAGPEAAWPAEPVVPGAPRWEPPPAFTAAAAGMQVWPAPVSDPPAMPPWPAATGELEPESDEAAHGATPDAGPAQTGPSTAPPPFDPNATNPHPVLPPSASRPPGPPAYSTGETIAAFSAPVPADTEETAPPAGARKSLPPAGRVTPTPGPKLPPSPLFDPKHNADAGNLAEPGDIPVWPPTPPEQDPPQQDKLPELPFSPEVWGHKPALALPPGGATPTEPPPQAAGTLLPGAFRQPPFAPLPVKQPGKSKRALFATLGVLVLAGVATGGFFAVRSVGTPEAAPPVTPPAATPTAAPAVTTPAEPVGTSLLNSEITDPKKLSLTEAFPKKKVSAAGAVFTRVKSDVAASCEEAASGPFAEALREQKCSRVVRATYVDAKRRWAVTTGIAVLPSKDAALRADEAKNLSRNLWFRGLPGSPGTGGDRVHIAGGYAAGLVWGRYIVFSYATHADGHTPAAKEKTLIKVSSAFRDQTSLVLERRITED